MQIILDTIPPDVLTMPHGGMRERGSRPRLVFKINFDLETLKRV